MWRNRSCEGQRVGRGPDEAGSLTQQPGRAGIHDAVLGRFEDGLGQRDGVSDHGSVQAVLGHHGAAAPALLFLPPLGSAVLEPHLRQEGSVSVSGFRRQKVQ